MKKFYFLFTPFLFFSVVIHAHTDKIPFAENKGQWNKEALFMAKIGGGTAWLEKTRFSFVFYDQQAVEETHHARHEGKPLPDVQAHAYRLNFINANPQSVINKSEKSESIHNYYLGNDPAKWAGGVNLYHRIGYGNLFSGIDLTVHSENGYFKYDYHIAPEADISQIKWNYEGVQPLLKNGKIIIPTKAGEVLEEKPVAWQIIHGEKKYVKCGYTVKDGVFGFEFPESYDPAFELIIDPTLIFSTYTGSTADNWGFTATYDNNGNLYAGGIVFANGYPTTAGAFMTSYAGGQTDVSITKFNPTGANLVYSTFLGGNNTEAPHSLIVDANGNLYVMGTTSSSNYPTSAGCYDNSFNGGTSITPNGFTYTNGSDIFITKFNSTGTALLGSTFIGGTANDGLNADATLSFNYSDEMRGEIILAANGDVLVTTSTLSSNFPATAGSLSQALQGTQDGCVFRMDNNLTGLLWSTYVGGTNADAGYGVKESSTGVIYVTGGTRSSDFPIMAGALQPAFGGNVDGYIISLNAANGSAINSTYLGTGSYDQSYLIEIDNNDDVYVTGQTKGAYPVTGGVYSNANGRQFIHKLNPALSTTGFSTVFGSGAATVNISPTAFLVDNCRNIYISGWGGTTNVEGSTTGLPVTGDAYQAATSGSDFYFIVLERDAQSLLYGSFFGGSPAEHVDGGTSRFDKNGVIYQAVCAGCGGSDNFPTTPGVWSNTNNSTNCNLGAIKMEFSYLGIDATANASPNIIACDPPYDVNFTGSPSAVNHIWDFDDGSPNSTSQNPSHTFSSIGLYNVMYVAIDSSTCNIADTAYLTVEILQAESFSATLAVAPYDPCVSGNYNVTLDFTGSGADSLVWDMGDGNVYINDTTVNHTYVNQGTYIITLTAYDFTCGLTGTITDTVTFNSTITTANANAAPNVIACDPPYDVNFTGSSTPNHYWDFGDGSPVSNQQNPTHTYTAIGLYNVMYIAIDSSTCNIADTAYLTVEILQAEIFDVTINIPPYDPCVSSNFTVALEFTGTGADSLIWDMGDGNIYTNDTMITHTYIAEGTYIITMTGYDYTCGLVETITDTVMFNSSITTAVANAAPNVIACDPPYDVTFTGSSTPNHYWDFGDGTPPSSQQNPQHTFTNIGNYTVTYIAIDSSTCNISDTVTLSVVILQAEEFSATFSPIPPQPCSDTVFVSVAFTGTGADSLVWNMGDGTIFIDDSTVTYFYTTPGNYTMTLTAYDFTCNETGSISQNIVVDEPSVDGVVIVPNVFSPNGDGVNDEFRVAYANFPNVNPVEYMTEYHLEIYNRWGIKVFESSSGETAWDGKFKGDPASEGVYFYIVKYQRECLDAEPAMKNGHVTLLRD